MGPRTVGRRATQDDGSPVQTITQYELATVEAKLYDVQTKQLVWAATTSTFNPRSVERETPAFADLVIRQLRDRDIIPAK